MGFQVTQLIKEAAGDLLAELQSHSLEVVLTPAPDQRHSMHVIRSVQDSNCKWYRDFCEQYQSSRKRRSFKSDTCIKRRDTINALERISDMLVGGRVAGVYVERLFPLICARAQKIAAHRRRTPRAVRVRREARVAA